MDVVALQIEAVKLIYARRFEDVRGYFSETWNRRTFAQRGVDVDFVQDNASLSHRPGTIRGLHFQSGAAAQVKLVRVVRGAIMDFAVDLRRSSLTFGKFACAKLTAAGGEQMLIPGEFAHGFCTLEPETEVAYKASAFYSPEHDAGILWNDPDLAIPWPLGGHSPVISDRDCALPRLSQIDPPF